LLKCEMQPEELVGQTPLLSITAGQGWQANFVATRRQFSN